MSNAAWGYCHQSSSSNSSQPTTWSSTTITKLEPISSSALSGSYGPHQRTTSGSDRISESASASSAVARRSVRRSPCRTTSLGSTAGSSSPSRSQKAGVIAAAGAGDGSRLRPHQRQFEGELAVRLVLALERVATAEARVAVALAGPANRLVDALEREVGEAVAVQLGRDLLDRAVVGDHLLARRHV